MPAQHCPRHGAYLKEEFRCCPDCETIIKLRHELNSRLAKKGRGPIKLQYPAQMDPEALKLEKEISCK